MSREKLVKIILTLLCIAVIFVIIIQLNKDYRIKTSGELTVKIINLEEQELANEKINFPRFTTLYDILKKKYHIKVRDNFLLEIDELRTPNDWSAFIAIYHNDEMVQVSFNKISFKNQDCIAFVMTKVI